MARDGVRTYGEIQNEALGDNAVLNNLALVKRIALHLKARVPDIIELDDMIQVGTIGLMEAVKSFRADEGVEFDFLKVLFGMKSGYFRASRDRLFQI